MTFNVTTELFELSRYGRKYPTGVMEVPVQIKGTAFFPGGHGLWKVGTKSPIFPNNGVMVLGHDFHSELAYGKSLKAGHEDLDGPTWGPLRMLLSEVGIPLTSCFFTNAYMGLRVGSKATGTFPGVRDKDFVSHCKRFFLRQLETQRPALILALGGYVPEFLHCLAPQLEVWKFCKTFKQRDLADCPVAKEVIFLPALPSYITTVVSLTHPSFRRLNVHRRSWRGEKGNAAEVEMLREAIASSNLRFS